MGIVKEIQLDINKAMSICIRNGVKVYPVPVGRMFAIEVDKGAGVFKRYETLVSSKEVAASQRKTYIAWAKQILKQKEDANNTKT
ncbi:hypothetical protein H9I45_15020 [Polaribacter haliotis]|uniref:Uncharacterized protein n=1 Tax=Polaribacter haliotis TaxID=1888915 RepID=A0A7L8AF92_9FLAO|nr:hypothetical protein [Polaribacter haliotis]QOD60630.1 hypothetical protein H9I45_15020 [Polaribacter haliotis]